MGEREGRNGGEGGEEWGRGRGGMGERELRDTREEGRI